MLRVKVLPIAPRSIEEAHRVYLAQDDPDWEEFERAVGDVLAGKRMGHEEGCYNSLWPMDFSEFRSIVHEDEPRAQCIRCGGIL